MKWKMSMNSKHIGDSSYLMHVTNTRVPNGFNYVPSIKLNTAKAFLKLNTVLQNASGRDMQNVLLLSE